MKMPRNMDPLEDAIVRLNTSVGPSKEPSTIGYFLAKGSLTMQNPQAPDRHLQRIDPETRTAALVKVIDQKSSGQPAEFREEILTKIEKTAGALEDPAIRDLLENHRDQPDNGVEDPKQTSRNPEVDAQAKK